MSNDQTKYNKDITFTMVLILTAFDSSISVVTAIRVRQLGLSSTKSDPRFESRFPD